MRTFTTEHTVYTFNELNDEAQAYAIEKEQEWTNEYGLDYLSDLMNEQAALIFERHGITIDEDYKVYYSLSYSQGDGAMVEGTFRTGGNVFEVQQSGLYYHERSGNVTESYVDNDEQDPVDATTYVHFSETYIAACQELAKFGYDEIDHATSEETIRDLLQDGDQEYYENGHSA